MSFDLSREAARHHHFHERLNVAIVFDVCDSASLRAHSGYQSSSIPTLTVSILCIQ